MLAQAELIEAFHCLRVSPADIQHLRRAPTYQIACQRLAVLKAHVQKERKRLALELHPDRTGGDEAKTALFKRISSLVDDIEKVQVPRPRPRPRFVPFPGVTISTNSGASNTGTAFTSTVSTVAWINGQRIV